ncbi:MAG: GTPase HflX [Deltaproteobacteria bacterium]|nr:GTPase HflX [Deltaproteobacteria bacterium]
MKALNSLYLRRCHTLFSPELAKSLTTISYRINRQVAVLLTRKGEVAFVIVGNHHQIVIPSLDAYRSASKRFRGLRLIHTHLDESGLTEDDLTDLALLRLDYLCAISVIGEGEWSGYYGAHLVPANPDDTVWEQTKKEARDLPEDDFNAFIAELETNFAKASPTKLVDGAERGILVGVATHSQREEAQESLEELKDLATSCGVVVYDSILQIRPTPDPKFVLGKGRLSDLQIRAMQRDVNLLIFDGELTSAQVRSIGDFVQIKVVDRTQVILDIFAARAQSREGKLQVELAQLKYLLPRLRHKDTAMSRLTGGIGARGPGETKLEISRRHVHERIRRLEKELASLQGSRSSRLSLRQKRGLPVISIVGYTNVGKSTLLNSLTKSAVFAEDMVFATLDTKSARLRLPYDQDVIITDTVGFIRKLPRELFSAFRATLDELQDADVLLHVIDASSPQMESQIGAVEKVLADLNLTHKKVIRVLNKTDLIVTEETLVALTRRLEAIPVCALQKASFTPLLEALGKIVKERR